MMGRGRGQPAAGREGTKHAAHVIRRERGQPLAWREGMAKPNS